jgi:Xaa-Pro dipeptidase
MKRTGLLLAASMIAALAGCGMEGAFSRSRTTAVRVGASERACAWLPGERDQWRLRRSAVREKVKRLVVPGLQKAELDAWLMVERDYQRDPMMSSLGLTQRGDKAVLMLDGGSAQPRVFGFASSPDVVWQMTESGLFEQVLPLTADDVEGTLDRFRPRRIGIDYSGRVPLADGITTGTRQFAAWLVGRKYAGTFRSAEALAVAFRSTRTAEETELTRQAARCAVEIAERALAAGLRSGQTSAEDLAWYAGDEIRAADVEAESLPRVFLIRPGDAAPHDWPWLGVNSAATIEAGDLLLIDLGLRYAGAAGTVQRTAYVPRRWQSQPPPDIRRAFAVLVEARGGVAPLFRAGRTGRQVAADAAAWAQQHQVRLDLLAHPVGDMPRDAGTLARDATSVGPYDEAGMLADRPLQEGDVQLLEYRVHVALDNGSQLTLSAADEGVVGYSGLDFLVPPPDAPMLAPGP